MATDAWTSSSKTAGGGIADADSGGTDRGAFFSGGGMVQLDSLLSHFAGVISGFDLGDAFGLWSPGSGCSTGAVNGPASADGEGQTFGLTLLGQFAANFSAGADGHGGSMITDPSASGSLTPTPLVMPHS